MSLSIKDAQVFKNALKAARAKKRLTQATCAELLGHSLSFQKDLERCRCSPSIEGFYHICRTLNISADDCIFSDSHKTDSTYHELLRLLSQCDEKDLSVLLATATALAGTDRSSVNGILMPQGRKKASSTDSLSVPPAFLFCPIIFVTVSSTNRGLYISL